MIYSTGVPAETPRAARRPGPRSYFPAASRPPRYFSHGEGNARLSRSITSGTISKLLIGLRRSIPGNEIPRREAERKELTPPAGEESLIRFDRLVSIPAEVAEAVEATRPLELPRISGLLVRISSSLSVFRGWFLDSLLTALGSTGLLQFEDNI